MIDTAAHRHSSRRMEMLDAASAALRAVQPTRAMANAVIRTGGLLQVGPHSVQLDDHRSAYIFGFGKASIAMGRAAAGLVKPLPVTGVLVSPNPEPAPPLATVRGSHPVPDELSLAAGLHILEAAATVGPDDLAVVVVSGGGSSLVTVPSADLSLADLAATNALLLRSGATINELNCVRKHLSAIKGGRLAEALSAAKTIVTLVISDVVGNPLDVIASGPMAPDPTTFKDALAIVDLYRLDAQLPHSIMQHLERGRAELVPETPKSGPGFDRQIVAIIADGAAAAEAAAQAGKGQAGPSRVASTDLQGEARQVAAALVDEAKLLTPGHSLVYAGETTVTVTGEGVGGRNQELALAASIHLDGRDDITILAIGTDGVDGMTASAGAFAHGAAVTQGRRLGLDAADHLERNDSHPFLAAIGDTVNTGPSGTNVGDLVIMRRD